MQMRPPSALTPAPLMAHARSLSHRASWGRRPQHRSLNRAPDLHDRRRQVAKEMVSALGLRRDAEHAYLGLQHRGRSGESTKLDTDKHQLAPTELRVQAPGAREARVPCPFAVRPDAVRSKFSKKRGVLTVRVEEA